MIPPSWQAVTDAKDRKDKSKAKSTTRKAGGVVLEKDIERAIQEAFRLKHRIVLFKTDSGCAGMRPGSPEGFRGYSGLPIGFPDLLGCTPGSGRVVVIECKRPGNKPTAHQEHYLALFRSWGGIGFWADSVDSALSQFREATRKGQSPPAGDAYDESGDMLDGSEGKEATHASDPGTVSNHG